VAGHNLADFTEKIVKIGTGNIVGEIPHIKLR
jgi:hypothetical protein